MASGGRFVRAALSSWSSLSIAFALDLPQMGAMSSQRLSNIVREAIWIAHGERCFYCRQPVLFADVEIDHFIPEAIPQTDLDALIEGGALPRGFDIQSEENLVPACRRDNCDKRALQFGERFIALQIRGIEERAKKARTRIKKQKKGYDLDQIFRQVTKSIEAGKFSADELAAYMQKLNRAPPTSQFMGTAVPPRAPKILVEDKARIDLKAMGLSLEKLALTLQRSAKSRQLLVGRMKGEKAIYVVRLDNLHRLLFTMKGEDIIIMGIESYRR